jgi:hypothetical protein
MRRDSRKVIKDSGDNEKMGSQELSSSRLGLGNAGSSAFIEAMSSPALNIEPFLCLP